MNSSTGSPSTNLGFRTRFIRPLRKTISKAALRAFRRRFSARVSFRLFKILHLHARIELAFCYRTILLDLRRVDNPAADETPRT